MGKGQEGFSGWMLEEFGGYAILAEGWWGASCGIFCGMSLKYIRIIRDRGVIQ